jgi:long-subunit fatty acid transport protein
MKNIIFGVSALAFAMPVLADKGFYSEVLLGSVENKVSYSTSGTVGGDSISDSGSLSYGKSTAFGIGGGYQFNEYVALEVGYRNHGEAVDKYVDEFGDNINTAVETKAVNFSVKAIYPFSESFSINGRIGLASWDLDISSTDSSVPDEVDLFSKSGNDIFWALGGTYSFNENVSLGLEYASLAMKWDENEVDPEFDVDFSSDIEYTVSGFFLVGKYHF